MWIEGETLPMPVVIRRADSKSPAEIHEEIRRAQAAELLPGTSSVEGPVSPRLQSLFFRCPAWLRDLAFWRWLFRNPWWMKETMGTVVVTAVGMAAPGALAWGIPLSLHPLSVGIGGIAQRNTPDGNRDVLALTILFDPAVVDGAPVGRFVRRVHELLTRVEALHEPDSTSAGGDPSMP